MADAWREDLKLREDVERYVRQGYQKGRSPRFLKAGFSNVYLEHSFVRQTFAMFQNLLQ